MFTALGMDSSALARVDDFPLPFQKRVRSICSLPDLYMCRHHMYKNIYICVYTYTCISIYIYMKIYMQNQSVSPIGLVCKSQPTQDNLRHPCHSLSEASGFSCAGLGVQAKDLAQNYGGPRGHGPQGPSALWQASRGPRPIQVSGADPSSFPENHYQMYQSELLKKKKKRPKYKLAKPGMFFIQVTYLRFLIS